MIREFCDYFRIRRNFWLLPFVLLLLIVFMPIGFADSLTNRTLFYYDMEAKHVNSTRIANSVTNISTLYAVNLKFNSTNGILGNYSYNNSDTGTSVITYAQNMNWSSYVNYSSNTSVSHSFWIYPKSYGNATTFAWIMSNDIGNYNGHGIYLNSTGRIAINDCTSVTSTCIQKVANTSLVLNSWTFVVIVANSTNITFYYNSTNVGITTTYRGAEGGNWSIRGSPQLGATSTFHGFLDEVAMFNTSLSQSEIDFLFNGGSPTVNQTYPFSDLLGANLTLTATDFYTGISLQNLTAVAMNASGYQFNASTTNGTLNGWSLLTNSSSLWNITVTSDDNGGYFNRTFINQNVSSGITMTLVQSAINFTATRKIVGDFVSTANFTTTYATNLTHYMRAQNYNVNVSATGFFMLQSNYTASALSVTSYNFENLTNSQVNLSLVNGLSGSPVTNFTVYVSNSTYGYNESFNSGSNNWVLLNLTNVSLNFYVTGVGYLSNSTNLTLNGSLYRTNITLTLFSDNAISFFFIDEITRLPMQNVSFDLISDVYSASYVSVGSNYTISNLPSADYQLRYGLNSTVLRPRSYIFRIPLVSIDMVNITLKTLNQSVSSLFDYIFQDLNADPLTDSFMELQRFYTNSTSWQQVERASIDTQGNAVFSGVPNTQFYRYVIYKNFTIISISSPFYLISTTQTIPVATTIGLLTTFNNFNGLQFSPINLTNASYLTFTYNDPSMTLTSICMNMTSIAGVNSTYTSSCSTGTSGTLTLYVDQNVSAFYTAVVSVIFSNSNSFIVDTYSLRTSALNGSSVLGKLSLFIVLITISVFGTLSFVQPEVGIICICISFIAYGVSFLGFTGVSIIANTTLLIIGTIVIWILERN